MWEVTLNKAGNVLHETVTAKNQTDARAKAERLNPGYRGGRTERL